jgi:hypothetical protein
MDVLTTWEASNYLAKHLPKRDNRKWFRYLKSNPKNHKDQDGFLINWHVVDGEMFYTTTSLKAFIAAHKFS